MMDVAGLSDCFFRFPTRPDKTRLQQQTISELETWKAATKALLEKARANGNQPTRSDNFLTGDNMKKWLAIFDKDFSNLEWTMKLEVSFDELLLETAKHSFIIRNTVVESLQALDFVAVTTADGGRNLKEDTIGVFISLADLLDGQNDGIREEINAGVPSEEIWSKIRPRGRANITSAARKMIADLVKLFEPGKFTVEWTQ